MRKDVEDIRKLIKSRYNIRNNFKKITKIKAIGFSIAFLNS